jgi:glycosyltransferase involved in cell wall biosynthesis
MKTLLPLSVIIATADRSKSLNSTLRSLSAQNCQPSEIIIIDASSNNATELTIKSEKYNLPGRIEYKKAGQKGAAVQRNEGVELAKYDIIGFMDDDIFLEPYCIENLWNACQDANVGGVNALITNQQYVVPGFVTRTFYKLMDGKKAKQPGGKLLGPLINVLPADDKGLGQIVPVEWLNTTCTFYNKKYLPQPPFDLHFKGYSLMEDVALSIRVGKVAKLYNVRAARIFHDTQPGSEKNNIAIMAEMELVNRYYVMKNVAGITGWKPYFKLLFQQLFYAFTTQLIFRFAFIKGKMKGIKKIMKFS